MLSAKSIGSSATVSASARVAEAPEGLMTVSQSFAQRLYEQGSDGQRRYLTDAELAAARASAKASMDVMCK